MTKFTGTCTSHGKERSFFEMRMETGKKYLRLKNILWRSIHSAGRDSDDHQKQKKVKNCQKSVFVIFEAKILSPV